jgi:diguanylate cyclase (GGDEF)-like protein/PAS domain S-box-containing protein
MKLTSLKHRFVLWFVVVGLLPLALFGYLSLQKSEDTLRTESLNRMSRLADKKMLEIKTYLAERSQNAKLFAGGRLIEEATSELSQAYYRYRPDSVEYNRIARKYRGYFANYIDESALFYDALLITPQGEIIYTHQHESDFATNLLNGPYQDSQLAQVFRESRITLESSISNFEFYAPSSAPAAFVSAPIIRRGVFKGVIVFQLNTERIYQVAMDPVGLGVTGETLLARMTDTGGALFVAPLRHDPQAALQRKTEAATTPVPMRHALAGERGNGIEVDYSGRRVVAAWRFLPELRWGMVVKMDTDEALATIYQQRKFLLETLLALAVLGGAFAFFFGRKMVVSLKTFARIADEIAKGDLNKRVDETREDEIGALGRAFNRMAENLQSLYRTLESRIEKRTRELSESNEQLQAEIIERKRVESELKNSRDQYDRLTTNIPIGVYLLRTTAAGEMFFKYVSARFCAMLGVTAELVYADSGAPFRAIHPDDLADFMKLKQVAVNTREPFVWEGRTQVGGVTRWLRIESKPEPLDNGDCIWDGVIVDITERRLAQLELQHNQDLLNEAQRLGQLGSWELDLVSGKLYWSDEIYRIFELDPAKFVPSYEGFLNVIHPDDRDKVNQAYTQSLENHQPYDVIHRLKLADGRIKWVREHCTSEFDTSGKPLRSVGAVQDITEQKLAEDRLRIAATAFETHEAILITDKNANIIRVNQAFQDITGYTSEEVLGKNPRILSSGRQDRAFFANMWQQLLSTGSWTGELWDKRKDGQHYPKWLTITAVKDERGETTEYVAIFSDITARKQAEEDIHNLAFYDSLTRLPNRRLLLDRFRLALSVSARSHHFGAVLFLDMDKFKTLNDTMGHDYGDLLLVEVARRIQACMREVDTVARLGGDEFVVLLEEVAANAEEASQKAAQIAEKIRVALAVPYLLKGHEYHSSPSIGVCLYRGNEESVDELLKHADMAMYQAKGSGRNAVHFFDPAMQLSVETRAALEADLRRAVSGKQLRLYYQIQVDNEQRPLGAEALVRWIHPKRGMVSPAQFIPIAEESSLILDIGSWVLETACRQLEMWKKNELTRNLAIAVNVSGQQFRLHDFVDKVAAVMGTHNIDPSLLKLELTESVILNDVADVAAKMHALKALGVKLSMDDFGTGYSSLSYLKQLPLDQIKIDQSFVRDIANDLNDAVMVQTIIGMAQNFRLNVIAEGVETEAQLKFLKQNGCMAYQGYLFGKPMPIKEFEAQLGEGQG